MAFKMGNPGCPCCDDCPCSCFTFNSDLKSSKGNHEFTAAGTTAFSSGKLGNALEVAHNATPHANVLTVPHDSCFSLEGGLSFWFWLYTEPDCTVATGVTSYFMSKGAYFAPAGGTNTAEYGVVLPVNKQCDQSSNQQYGVGIRRSTGGHQLLPFDDPAYEGGPGAITGPVWTFYFSYYDPNVTANGTFYTSINGAGFVTGGVTGGVGSYTPGGTALISPIVPNTEPLRLFEFISPQADTLKIDNLGFCKNIPAALSDGTTTETQMAARAASLYNSGTGKACNEWE